MGLERSGEAILAFAIGRDSSLADEWQSSKWSMRDKLVFSRRNGSHRTYAGWRAQGLPGAILVLIGTFLVLDLVTDRVRCAEEVRHQIVEGIAALVALGGAAWVFLLLWTRSNEIQSLSGDLAAAREESQRWKGETAELLKGLSEAIHQQFARWDLTQAEREVALFLIKGVSIRDISTMRNTRESTARQQAQVVYRKANLEGRAELAAFFLEDLLSPHSDHREAAG